MRIVFKHNPLGFHKDAMPAAKAAMAAHAQGKFWEFHDLAFTTKKLSAADLESYAQQIGLDLEKWRADMNSQQVLDKILHDQSSMVKSGAGGTPSFFINGKPLKGAQPFPAFQTAIEEALKEADAEIAKGTPADNVSKVLTAKNAGQTFVDWVWDGKAVTGAASPGAAADAGQGRDQARRQPEAPSAPVKIDLLPDDPVKGNPEAAITIVEFSDFQCPYCSKVPPVLKSVVEQYGKDVKIIFKQFPLNFHKEAEPSARASLAAHKQGKFWEYHDLLFENQRALSATLYDSLAQQLGLNMEQFKKDMADPAIAKRVQDDMAAGQRAGVRGTPTAYLNGVKLGGASSFEAYKTAIETALAKNRGEAVPDKPAGPTLGSLEATKVKIEGEGALSLGPAGAADTIVVFLDLQDTFSAQVVGILEQLQKESAGKLRVVIRHFPLPFREKAPMAAAALAAATALDINKALVYLKSISESANELSEQKLKDLATAAGLDAAKIDGAWNSAKWKELVDADIKAGKAAGVMASPTLFMNGRKYTGMKGYEKDMLSAALAESRQ